MRIIQSFNGGVAEDIRTPLHYQARMKILSTAFFSISKHFDIFSQPFRITPYRNLVADTNDGSTSTGMKQYAVRDFLYPIASGKLHGLGQTGVGLTQIFTKAVAESGNWSIPASSSGNGAVQNGCFVEYKDYIFGFQGTTQIFKYGTLSSGTPTIANSASATGVAITSVAQGLVFNDYLYLPYNNKIWRATDATTFSDAYLTLPTQYKITSITSYGKYIAIACAPISTFNGNSKVFLWDGTSTDVQENIDWGEGQLSILETIEGMLVGITDRYLNNTVGAGRGSMIIQTYSGGTPQVIKEIFTQALTGKMMPLSKAVKNNRLFWSAKIMTNATGTTYDEGIWSFGRKGTGSPFALTLDIVDENVNTSGIQAFGTAANYFFIAHSSDGSIDKTSVTATYTFTSIVETLIFNWMTAAEQKRINYVEVTFVPIVSPGSFTLKYKVDEATSWTTIGTYNAVGQIHHTFLNIESTGAAFAVGKEFQFRLESLNGLEVLGVSIDAEVLPGFSTT